jgi:NitT/TauT family transport system substrate-binding protein
MASPTRVRLGGVLVVLLLLLAACGGGGGGGGSEETAGGGDTEAEEGGGGETTPFTLVTPIDSAIQWHPAYVAMELGYFEEEGLEVELVPADGSSAAIQQMLGGQAQAGIPSPGAFLTAVDSGQDLRWIYSYEYSNVFTIITTPDAGVEELADLEGQRLGISEPGGGEVPLARATLREAGLTEGQNVEFVPIGEGSALTVQALESGEVQAYCSSVFDVASIQAAGIETVDILPESAKGFPSNGIAVTAEALESNPEQLAAFARAFAKGVVFSMANPEAAFAIAEAAKPEEFEDQALAEANIEAITSLIQVPEDLQDEPVGAHNRPGWEGYNEFLTQGSEEEGALSGPVDLDTVLVDDLLEQINDFDRAEIEQAAEEYEGASG